MIHRVGSRPAFAAIPADGSSTVGDYIDSAVSPYVSGELISPESLAEIQEIARWLPGGITDFFGFECDLGTGRPAADFLVCCRTRQGAREVLAGRRPGCEIPSALLQHPIWRRIRGFSEEWANRESPLYQGVHNMWFEFDVTGVPAPVPVPSVFIGSYGLRPMPPADDLYSLPARCEWLTDRALPILQGAQIDAAVRRQVAHCLNRLPATAHLFQVGLMLARDSKSVRLCVRGVSQKGIVEYLNLLNWEGSPYKLLDLLDALGKRVQRIDLDLDVADRVLLGIAIECYPGWAGEQQAEFLAHLVATGLCTGLKAEAADLWSGMVDERPRPDTWPRDLRAASDFAGGRFQSTFVRTLHHVKVVYESGMEVRAKGYFGVHHKWLPV